MPSAFLIHQDNPFNMPDMPGFEDPMWFDSSQPIESSKLCESFGETREEAVHSVLPILGDQAFDMPQNNSFEDFLPDTMNLDTSQPFQSSTPWRTLGEVAEEAAIPSVLPAPEEEPSDNYNYLQQASSAFQSLQEQNSLVSIPRDYLDNERPQNSLVASGISQQESNIQATLIGTELSQKPPNISEQGPTKSFTDQLSSGSLRLPTAAKFSGRDVHQAENKLSKYSSSSQYKRLIPATQRGHQARGWTLEGVFEANPSRVGKKPRRRRLGPEERVRVAETRKIHACIICRARNVKVNKLAIIYNITKAWTDQIQVRS